MEKDEPIPQRPLHLAEISLWELTRGQRAREEQEFANPNALAEYARRKQRSYVRRKEG